MSRAHTLDARPGAPLPLRPKPAPCAPTGSLFSAAALTPVSSTCLIAGPKRSKSSAVLDHFSRLRAGRYRDPAHFQPPRFERLDSQRASKANGENRNAKNRRPRTGLILNPTNRLFSFSPPRLLSSPRTQELMIFTYSLCHNMIFHNLSY